VSQKSQKIPDNSLLVDLPAACALVGCSLWSLRGLISRKELPIIKVGKKFFIRRATLTRWTETAEETL
jgi:excisionase family DNA binding protein